MSTTKYIFLFFLCAIFYHTKGQDIVEIRKKFYLSVESHSEAKSLLKELDGIKNAQPIVLGYKAAVNMLMAKHAFNPYNKFKYFFDGKSELEKAIATDSLNAELRLIRFAIQNNAPTFLGYSEHIQKDKKKLLQEAKAPNTDLAFRKILKSYLLESKHTTAEEKTWLDKI